MAPVRRVCLLYAGVLLGVSFIATPAKFLAPGLRMDELLLVGRATFVVFGWVEGVFVSALLLAAFVSGRGRGAAVLVAAVVLVQHAVLRPVLDEGVTEVLAGAESSAGPLHLVYGLLELAKLVVLLGAGLTGCSANATATAHHDRRVV